MSGSDDSNVKIWLISTGTCIRTINVGAIVKCLALLKSGYLAVGLYLNSNNIIIYDINNGNAINTISAHTRQVNTLEVFPNGDLVSGSVDNYVKVWDMSTFAQKFSNGLGNNVNCLKILSNGNIVLGLVKNGMNLCIWVPGSASSLYSATHSNTLTALEVLANDNIVSSSETDPNFTLIIWDKTLIQIGTLTGQAAISRALKILSNGLLASGTDTGEMNIWNISTGALVKSLTFSKQISVLMIEYKSKIDIYFFLYIQSTLFNMNGSDCI